MNDRPSISKVWRGKQAMKLHVQTIRHVNDNVSVDTVAWVMRDKESALGAKGKDKGMHLCV
jgi:hypothetical protein